MRIGGGLHSGVIFIFLFLCIAPGTSSHGEPLESRVLQFVDSPFPPYVMGEIGKPPAGGISIDIFNEVCRQLNVRGTVELVPWPRVLKMLETGRADGVLTLLKSPERERFLLYTVPFMESRELVYWNRTLQPVFDWQEFADLRGYTIGLVTGYVYGDDFMAAVEELDLRVEYTESSELNMKKLAAGRVNLIVEEEQVADYLIRVNSEKQEIIGKHPKSISEYLYYMAFSRHTTGIRFYYKFNKQLADLVTDGTIKRIIEAYTE